MLLPIEEKKTRCVESRSTLTDRETVYWFGISILRELEKKALTCQLTDSEDIFMSIWRDLENSPDEIVDKGARAINSRNMFFGNYKFPYTPRKMRKY